MILGHEKQIARLKKIYESGKIPHAFLFCGKSGLGKKQVALEFASWILGKKIENNPDFTLIEPKSKKIQIDEIRELIRQVSLKTFLTGIKIVVIDSAEKMTSEAQNCFLKTLEEPKNTLFILISEFPFLLLPTIISRCQVIKFFPVEKHKIEKFLRENVSDEKTIKMILKISEGRPGIAFDLLNDTNKLKEIEKIFENIEKMPKTSISFRFNYAKKLLTNFDFLKILEFLMVFFRERILSNLNEKDLKLLQEIQKIYFFSLTTNIDQRLALENILLKI